MAQSNYFGGLELVRQQCLSTTASETWSVTSQNALVGSWFVSVSTAAAVEALHIEACGLRGFAVYLFRSSFWRAVSCRGPTQRSEKSFGGSDVGVTKSTVFRIHI